MELTIHHHASAYVPGPGLYEMTAAQYHADPCPSPSLSASIACTLLFESPLHAWYNHPRLRPDWEPEEANRAMKRGSVAHELILGKGGGFETLEFDNWLTKAAKEARTAAIDAGKVPILRKELAAAETMSDAVVSALQADRRDDFFDPDARSELVVIWQEPDGTWCRAMLDRLTPGGTVYDVKTSARGLSDRTLQNRFYEGFAVQPVFYKRGLSRLFPGMAGRFRWTWVFAEQDPPHAVRILNAGNAVSGLGEWQVEEALRIWRLCLGRGRWPGYARGNGALEPPDRAVNDWSERMERVSPNAPLEQQAAE